MWPLPLLLPSPLPTAAAAERSLVPANRRNVLKRASSRVSFDYATLPRVPLAGSVVRTLVATSCSVVQTRRVVERPATDVDFSYGSCPRALPLPEFVFQLSRPVTSWRRHRSPQQSSRSPRRVRKSGSACRNHARQSWSPSLERAPVSAPVVRTWESVFGAPLFDQLRQPFFDFFSSGNQ